jgi:hypothetical protein
VSCSRSSGVEVPKPRKKSEAADNWLRGFYRSCGLDPARAELAIEMRNKEVKQKKIRPAPRASVRLRPGPKDGKPNLQLDVRVARLTTQLVTLGDRNTVQFRQVLFEDALAPLEVPQQIFRPRSIEAAEPKAVNKPRCDSTAWRPLSRFLSARARRSVQDIIPEFCPRPAHESKTLSPGPEGSINNLLLWKCLNQPLYADACCVLASLASSSPASRPDLQDHQPAPVGCTRSSMTDTASWFVATQTACG